MGWIATEHGREAVIQQFFFFFFFFFYVLYFVRHLFRHLSGRMHLQVLVAWNPPHVEQQKDQTQRVTRFA